LNSFDIGVQKVLDFNQKQKEMLEKEREKEERLLKAALKNRK